MKRPPLPAAILVVDDERTIRDTLRWSLEREGHHVVTAASGAEAVARLSDGAFDIAIVDIVMPGIDGAEVLRQAQQATSPPAVILMTAYATVGMAVEALRRGAADYIVKPFRLLDVRARVHRLLVARSQLGVAPVASGRQEATVEQRLVGRSRVMEGVRQQIARVGPTSAHVLVTGETGTGKELVARSIHANSPRATQPFVAVNCGAIPEGLFEATSAVHPSPGLIGAADRGTLLLDEIGETPAALQVNLLRVLEDKTVPGVGRTTPVSVDCRVIATTNRDLQREVEAGRFREDLFHRLRVVHIGLPPLRRRREDIPLLAESLVERLNATLGTQVHHLEPASLEVLMEHDWPGNVRELLHVLESAIIASGGRAISADDLPLQLSAPVTSLKEATRRFERQHIMDVLARVDFNKREAARRLGVSLASLYRKIAGDRP